MIKARRERPFTGTWLVRCSLVAVCALLLPPVVSAGADEGRGKGVIAAPRGDDSVAEWNAQKQRYEEMVKKFDALGRQRIGDVLRLSVEKRFLAFSTALADTPGEMPRQLTLEKFTGLSFVTLHRDTNGALERFNLNVTAYPQPRHISTLSVTYSGGALTICRTTRIDENIRQVMLVQRRGLQSSGGDGLELLVTESEPVQPLQLSFASDDFTSFLRDHPKETNLFVRPLLRQVNAEPLLCPDALTAWQVFNDLRQPDPAMARRVDELLPGLNDADYHVRNEALAKLKHLGRDAADVIDHMDRAKLSPEQNVRLDRFLVQLEQLPPSQVARLRVDPTFLLDCLYCEDITVRQSALDRLRTMFRPDLDFDINAPADVRAAVVATLRQQITPGR